MPQSPSAAVEIESQRPRGRPRADDRAALESRLVRVACQCFTSKGYGATSMSEVARAARVSKKTLYSRFASKADLFRAILEAQIRRTGGVVRLQAPAAETLETMLRLYAEHTLQESLSPEILQLNRLIYSEAGRFPELGEAALARRAVGVTQVAELLCDFAIKDGVPCRDPDGAGEMFIALLTGWYSGMMLRSRPVTEAEITAWTRQMLDVFLASRGSW